MGREKRSWSSQLILIAIGVLVLGRILVSVWHVQLTDSAYFGGDADHSRRLEASSYLDVLTIDATQEPPGALFMLSLTSAITGELLVAPAILAAFSALLTLVALAGITWELFPTVRRAALLAVALLAYQPLWCRIALTSRPETWSLAACAFTIWFMMRSRRTGSRRDEISYGVCMLIALFSSFDCWLVLGPVWTFELLRFLRRPRSQRTLVSWLVHGLSITPVVAWLTATLAVQDGPIGFLQTYFGLAKLTSSEGSFSAAFTALAISTPITIIGLPMLVVSKALRAEGHKSLPRSVSIGLLLLLVSTYLRSRGAESEARLLIVLTFLCPSIAGCTILILKLAVDRPMLPRLLVWSLAAGQVTFSIVGGTPEADNANEGVQLGLLVRDLYREQLLAADELVVMQNRAHNEELSKDEKRALGSSTLTQLFNPGMIRKDAVIPPEMDAMAPKSLRKGKPIPVDPKEARRRLERRSYGLIVAVGANTRRVLKLAQYQRLGMLGSFTLFKLSPSEALSTRVTETIEQFQQEAASRESNRGPPSRGSR